MYFRRMFNHHKDCELKFESMYILTCNWILFNYVIQFLMNESGLGWMTKTKWNWVIQWFYLVLSQWMYSVVTHIGILNNALCKLHLAHFKCRKKVCTVVNATLRQYRSCVHYMHTVRNIARSSFKGGMRFLIKVSLKMCRKRETYKSTSKKDLV